jgi:hypothetical protein
MDEIAMEKFPMKFGEFFIVGAVWVVPLWLVLRAWHRYFRLSSDASTTTFSARAALVLLSFSSGMWLIFYALVLMSEFSKVARSTLNLAAAPPTLAVVNLVVSVGAFVLSLLIPKTAHGTAPIRTASIIATSYMSLIWIFALVSH